MPESGLLGRAATSMCRLNCTVGSNPTLFVCPNSSVGRALLHVMQRSEVRVFLGHISTKDVTDECNFKSKSKDMISAVINHENAIAPKLNLKVHEREGVIGFYKDRSFIYNFI